MFKRPEIRLAVLGIALLGSSAAWYLIAPLFTGQEAHSIFPTLALMPSTTPKPPTATPLPTETAQATSVGFSMGPAVELVAVGEFYEVTHAGSGTASVYLTETGDLVLSLEDFEVEEGPDLRLYVTEQEVVTDAVLAFDESIDLGLLEAFSGNQVYELPEDLDLSQYQSIVVWCDTYQEPFIAASLDSP
jgi:hypothetical protein